MILASSPPCLVMGPRRSPNPHPTQRSDQAHALILNPPLPLLLLLTLILVVDRRIKIDQPQLVAVPTGMGREPPDMSELEVIVTNPCRVEGRIEPVDLPPDNGSVSQEMSIRDPGSRWKRS